MKINDRKELMSKLFAYDIDPKEFHKVVKNDPQLLMELGLEIGYQTVHHMGVLETYFQPYFVNYLGSSISSLKSSLGLFRHQSEENMKINCIKDIWEKNNEL